jgi:AraC-like DNA-binding protein
MSSKAALYNMFFNIPLQDYHFNVKLENCSIKILAGNWGEFIQSFTNHMHSYYELHYVTGGQGTLVTDNIKMPLAKGCFYLLPPKTNHEQWSSRTEHLKEYHLAFELISSSDKDYAWIYLFSNGYYSTDIKELEVHFDNIAKETSDKQYGYLDMINKELQAIFIKLIRSISQHNIETIAPAVNLDDRRSMVIDDAFIFEYNSITLAELSNQLKLSTRQTQRFIQAKYGVSFSTLKYRSRLSHAAMLLSTTKLPLEEICNRVGYKNYSFFSKAFKQQYHMTPAYYRKNHTIE